ncbi:fibronectin type III domain-containing protein [Marinobacter sp.]|uniref:fibronectin type III domain-containing protein n=1 Tax=Marinobacter sp. TaxID=50741 RepID=UPI003566F29C
MKKRVIKMSKAWIAAFALGMLLTGCGGGGGSDDAGPSTSASASGKTTTVGATPKTESAATAETPRSAVLSWSAPATRVNGDGIDMGELDKYVIRYGQNVDDLNQEVVLEDAAEYPEMSYTVKDLDPGTWFFTIQVQDTQGLVSEPSEPVSKHIQS